MPIAEWWLRHAESHLSFPCFVGGGHRRPQRHAASTHTPSSGLCEGRSANSSLQAMGTQFLLLNISHSIKLASIRFVIASLSLSPSPLSLCTDVCVGSSPSCCPTWPQAILLLEPQKEQRNSPPQLPVHSVQPPPSKGVDCGYETALPNPCFRGHGALCASSPASWRRLQNGLSRTS